MSWRRGESVEPFVDDLSCFSQHFSLQIGGKANEKKVSIGPRGVDASPKKKK